MAELFSVRAPLMIRSPHGGEKVIAELFPHPEGILFYEIFWDQLPGDQGLYLVRGAIKGEGPWKVGDYVINVLGCQGSQPELAADYGQWQLYLASNPGYPDRESLGRRAMAYCGQGTDPEP